MKLALVLLVTMLSCSGCGPRVRVLSTARADLDRDHVPETVTITYRGVDHGHPMGGEILVARGGREPIWRQRNLNPWKLRIGDVDGDGRPEVIVGVWKKSPRDPVMAKRTFVYSWNGRRLMPKWLGSRLSRRFDDFTVADINHDDWDELISLEVAPHGNHRVAVYRWRSFGFDWQGCSAELPGLSSLAQAGGGAVVETPKGKARILLANGVVTLQRGGSKL